MLKLFKICTAVFTVSFLAGNLEAAVVPEYAANNYSNHELSRSEKKCLEEGYKITYANCSNQTAPADRCPYHDAYYRSCSQEQWCRNNNYRFLAKDCKLPLYPLKMCDNSFPLYRTCQENIIKACEDSGYSSKDDCKLTDKRCPFSRNYGLCCGQCEGFSHLLNKIPEGYVATGEVCVTCSDVAKTNIRPAPCKGFLRCAYGPMSPRTPSCLQGTVRLFSACKSADTLCKEKGYLSNSCLPTEDAEDCPENPVFKKCHTNCFKLAQSLYPDADIIDQNVTNPTLDLTKREIRSLVGMTHPDCRNQQHPTVSLTISRENIEQYQNVFDRMVSNISFDIVFLEPLPLTANGQFNNVKINFSGSIPECALQSTMTPISGVVSFVDAPALCMNFTVSPKSKLLTTGSINGNIELQANAALGIKENLNGYLKTESNTDVFIKGRLTYTDNNNNDIDDASIIFGCSSKSKIAGGIFADTASVILKPWAKLDTAEVTLKSTSDNLSLPNTLASIHMFKYTNLFSTYDSGSTVAVFRLAENNYEQDCEDKYYIHLGSALDASKQVTAIEPSNRMENEWKCRKIPRDLQSCD